MKWFLTLFVFTGSSIGFGQVNINGDATIQLVDGGTNCMGSMRLVDVYVDTSGCTAASGDSVGLNGFRLDFSLGPDTTLLYAASRPGNTPVSFSVVASEHLVVAIGEQVTLVGRTATPNAPQGPYHVAKSEWYH